MAEVLGGMEAMTTKSGVYVYYSARCPQCEWVCASNRRDEIEAWGDLQAHLRHSHGGNVAEIRVKRTVTEEVLPPREEDEAEAIPIQESA